MTQKLRSNPIERGNYIDLKIRLPTVLLMNKSRNLVLNILFLFATLGNPALAQKKGANIGRGMGKATEAAPGTTSFTVPNDGKNYIVKCNFGSAKDMSRIASVLLKTLPEGDQGKGFLRRLLENAADEKAKEAQSKAVMKIYDSSGKMIGQKKIGKLTGFGRNLAFRGSGEYTAKIEITKGTGGYWFLTWEHGDNT